MIIHHYLWQEVKNKSSAVAEMGDRAIAVGHKVGRGATVPLSVWELDPNLTQCRLGRAVPKYQVAS